MLKRYVQLMVIMLYAMSMVVPYMHVFAEEINEDSTQRSIIEGVLDEEVFSVGGALLSEEGEFFTPTEEEPVEIVENVNNTSSSVTVKGDMEIISDNWSGKSAKNTYRFVGDGILKAEDGTTYKSDKWFNILQAKENYLAQRMKEIDKNGFKDLSFNGDLDTNLGDSFWVENVEDIRQRYGGTITFRINDGSQNHFIILDGTNQTSMNWTLKAIDIYKDTVRHGLIRGSIAASYNVYSFYGVSPVKLKDVLKEKADGTYEIKSGTNVAYEAQYFLNPLFGKMKYSDVINDKSNLLSDYRQWEDYTGSIKIIHVAGNKLIFGLNNQYYSFLAEDNDYNKFLSNITNLSETKGNGLKGYKPKYGNNITVKPKDIADAGLYIMSIKNLAKNASSNDGQYQLIDSGIQVYTTMKYLPKDNNLYAQENGIFKRKGSLNEQGLDLENLYLYKANLNGVTVGGIFPTVYKEVIYNPADSKEYYTGRTVHLLSDFYTNLKLDDSNASRLAVKADTMTDYGEKLRAYAFKEGGTYTNKDSHAVITGTPNLIELETTVRLPQNKKVYGAIIYRNNQYANDAELLKWLDTDKAKSMTDEGVEASILKELIKGALKLEETDLTYEEYLRMEEIKEEMANITENTLIGLIITLLGIIGYVLCCYGIILFLVYAVDIVNPFSEASLLRIITFGRLYPIMHKSELDFYGHIDNSESKLTFVTWYHMLFISFIIITLGVLFIVANPIINFIVKVFEIGGSIIG